MSTGVFTALTPQNRPLDFQKTQLKLPQGGYRPELCPLIRKHLSAYLRAITVAHGVGCNAQSGRRPTCARKAWRFSSLARGEDRPDSDIDIMAEIAPDPRIRLGVHSPVSLRAPPL